MLLSWISSRLAQTDKRAGIYIGRQQVCGVMLLRQSDGWHLASSRVVQLSSPLFDAAPNPAAEVALQAALQEIAGGFGKGFVPLSVGLPDTAIRSNVFELEELPKTQSMQQDWLSWRFAKVMQRAEETITCKGQALGAESGKQLYFAQALERNWHEMLLRALDKTGVMPWTINAISACQHNVFYDVFEAGGGALLTLDAECWGYQLWDSAKRLRYVRSRWRAVELDFSEMISEVERVIRSHSGAAPDFQVERLYVSGQGPEVQELQLVLNQKLHQGVTRLQLPRVITEIAGRQNAAYIYMAFMAALNHED